MDRSRQTGPVVVVVELALQVRMVRPRVSPVLAETDWVTALPVLESVTPPVVAVVPTLVTPRALLERARDTPLLVEPEVLAIPLLRVRLQTPDRVVAAPASLV